MQPRLTSEQVANLSADQVAHRTWLAEQGLAEPKAGLGEDAYTGLLLSALLDPGAAAAVYEALLPARPATPGGPPRVREARWPSSGVDLIVEAVIGNVTRCLLMEHKRFKSPSHAPGYRTNPEAAWQTDQTYEAAIGSAGAAPIPGVPAGSAVDMVVLDAGDRTMAQMFPGGEHNAHWQVTGYRNFGAALRARHAAGTTGLVPLLRALYASPELSPR